MFLSCQKSSRKQIEVFSVNKKTVVIIILLFILGLGAFGRFYNLQNNVVWDNDAAIYSIYSKKYYKIFRLGLSPEFRDLVQEKKLSGQYQTVENLIQGVKVDPRFINLTNVIPKTEQVFPDWVAKPAYIFSAALFRFLNNGENSLLYFSALAGFLIIPTIFFLGLSFDSGVIGALCSSLLVALSPILVGYSRTGQSNIVAALFLTLALLPYLKSLQSSQKTFLCLVCGIIAGIALLFHPGVFLFFPVIILLEIFLSWKKWRTLVARVSYLFLGLMFALFLGEVLLLAASIISLLFTGRLIKPFIHSFFSHGDLAEPFHPFFYLQTITLYEGIFFSAAFLAILYFFFRYRFQDKNTGICLFLFWGYLLFFSLFTFMFPAALRNIIFIMIPAYLVFGKFMKDFFSQKRERFFTKQVALISFFLSLHVGYAFYTNWQNSHFTTHSHAVISYLREAHTKTIYEGAGKFYIENLLGEDPQYWGTPEGHHLYLYREIEGYENDPRILKNFQMNVYDRKIFILDTPQYLPLLFDPARRETMNRIFIAKERL